MNIVGLLNIYCRCGYGFSIALVACVDIELCIECSNLHVLPMSTGRGPYTTEVYWKMAVCYHSYKLGDYSTGLHDLLRLCSTT